MSITFFDTETSGLVDPEVIQAAYLSTDVQFKRLDSFEKLFSCSKPIEWDAMALHGITNEQLYLKDRWGIF